MTPSAGALSIRTTLIAGAALLTIALSHVSAAAEPVAVRFTEGVTRGFPTLRSLAGERLAHGDLVQVPRGDRVESRMVFRFKDGSLYDETAVYTQKDVFTLQSYKIVQRGPSFPESIEATFDRASGRYTVRYKADQDSPEEVLDGKIELPEDVYNGLLTTLIKNLPAGASVTVQIVAFTPKPRLVKMLLAPAAQDAVVIGEAAMQATRFVMRPQLGLFASLLVAEIPDVKCWIVPGEAPAFLRFEGPLYFMGPIWRIELT
jgi:hypothetical protein